MIWIASNGHLLTQIPHPVKKGFDEINLKLIGQRAVM